MSMHATKPDCALCGQPYLKHRFTEVGPPSCPESNGIYEEGPPPNLVELCFGVVDQLVDMARERWGVKPGKGRGGKKPG